MVHKSAWGRKYMREEYPENPGFNERSISNLLSRWTDAFQNDFAARADWCVKSYDEANHPPVVKLDNALDITAKPGAKLN